MPKNNILDTSPRFKRDPGNVGAAIFRLADQLRDGFRQARQVKLPFAAKDIDAVLVAGMGAYILWQAVTLLRLQAAG